MKPSIRHDAPAPELRRGKGETVYGAEFDSLGRPLSPRSRAARQLTTTVATPSHHFVVDRSIPAVKTAPYQTQQHTYLSTSNLGAGGPDRWGTAGNMGPPQRAAPHQAPLSPRSARRQAETKAAAIFENNYVGGKAYEGRAAKAPETYYGGCGTAVAPGLAQYSQALGVSPRSAANRAQARPDEYVHVTTSGDNVSPALAQYADVMVMSPRSAARRAQSQPEEYVRITTTVPEQTFLSAPQQQASGDPIHWDNTALSPRSREIAQTASAVRQILTSENQSGGSDLQSTEYHHWVNSGAKSDPLSPKSTQVRNLESQLISGDFKSPPKAVSSSQVPTRVPSQRFQVASSSGFTNGVAVASSESLQNYHQVVGSSPRSAARTTASSAAHYVPQGAPSSAPVVPQGAPTVSAAEYHQARAQYVSNQPMSPRSRQAMDTVQHLKKGHGQFV